MSNQYRVQLNGDDGERPGSNRKDSLCLRPRVSILAVVGVVFILFMAFAVPLIVVSSKKESDNDGNSSACPLLPAEDAAVESTSFSEITVFSDEFYQYADRGVTMELLSLAPYSYGYLEGPLWDEETQSVLFSDVAGNSIYSWNNRTGVSVFLRPAGYIGALTNAGVPFPGPNGQIFGSTNNGRKHVFCQQGEARIVEVSILESFTPIAEEYDGKKFLSPNDVVQDDFGWYWFTDLNIGRLGNADRVNVTGVYAAKNGTVVRVIDDVVNPNGIAHSSDNSVLVSQSGNMSSNSIAIAWKYYFERIPALDNQPVSTTNRTVFIDATPFRAQYGWIGHGDGMKLDQFGNAWMAMPGGILCVNKQGELLARLDVQATATNVWIASGGGRQPYIYFTTATPNRLIRLRLKA
eukprot:jgi/Bigna1/128737/aug1.7_g3445